MSINDSLSKGRTSVGVALIGPRERFEFIQWSVRGPGQS